VLEASGSGKNKIGRVVQCRNLPRNAEASQIKPFRARLHSRLSFRIKTVRTIWRRPLFDRSPGCEAFLGGFGSRHVERDGRALGVAELKRLVAPRHRLQFVHELNLVLQAVVFGVNIVDLELDIGGAICAGLGAALLSKGDGLSTAYGKRGRWSDNFREDGREPVCRLPGHHFIESDHALNVRCDQTSRCEFHDDVPGLTPISRYDTVP